MSSSVWNLQELLQTKLVISFFKLHKTIIAFNILNWNYLLGRLPSPLGHELYKSKGCVYSSFYPPIQFNSANIQHPHCNNFKVGT